MALEQRWSSVPATALTIDGTTLGIITVNDTIGFKDKQLIILKSNTLPQKEFQIKRVMSTTQIVVGPVNNKVSINDYSDISMYTVADNATVGANEQPKLALPPEKDHYSAVYESSPTNADRVISVDSHGNPYSSNNPMPITGNITVSSTPLHYDDVKLTRDSDGDITLVRKYIGGILKLTQSLIYDSNKNVIEIKDI